MKNTKKSLLVSVLSLMLCVAMLLGTTYAWFTDSVQSGVNTIQAGNLDVELFHKSKNVSEEKVTATTENLFTDVAKWEPGAYAYETFTVKNVGDLALKYKMELNVASFTSYNGHNLTEVLKVAVLNSVPESRADITDGVALKDWSLNGADVLYPANAGEGKASEKTFTVAIYWEPTNHDNDFNMNNGKDGTLSIEFGVNLIATQYTYEADSFDNLYDALAQYPVVAEAKVVEDQITKITAYDDNNKIAAQAKIPANAVLPEDTERIMMTVDEVKTPVQVNLANDEEALNLDVKFFAVKSDGTKTQITDFDQIVEVDLSAQIPDGRVLAKVFHTHNGVPVEMEKVESKAAVADGKYYFDAATKMLTIGSKKFSPFTFIVKLPEVIASKEGEPSIGMSLAEFRNSVNNGKNYSGWTVTQQKDIDLENVEWSPIGTKDNPFSGVFNGNNKTISNLTVNANNGAEGLFGYVIGEENSINIGGRWNQDTLTYNTFEIEKDLTCSIMNLKISNASITTTDKKATGVIGSGECAYIYNISVENSAISGAKGVGGIIGNVNGCVIKNCSTDSNTSVTASVYNAGGIVGVSPSVEKSFCTSKHGCAIIECVNNADVTMNNTSESGYIGGIVGSFNAMGGQHNAFISCTNNGTIHIPQKSKGVGGIVGDAYNNGEEQYFVNCINNGSFDFSDSSSCDGVGGIAQNTAVVGVNLINTANITACATDVSGISSKAPAESAFYNCFNNGTLNNTKTSGAAYDISSRSGDTIGITGTFATVAELNASVNSQNTDKGIRRNFKLTNVTVTNQSDYSLIVPKNAESFVINGKVADTVDFEEGAICPSIVYANGYNFHITKNNSRGITIVGDNNAITVDSTLASLGISGNSSVTVNADLSGSLNFSGTGTTTATINAGKTVHCVRFLGTGNYTVNNYGLITNNGGGGHVIYTESPCTITVNNHGTIQNRVTGPTYALLFYGGCDATVNQYPGSIIDTRDETTQYGYKADGSAHSVVVRNVDDSGNPIT